VLKLEITIFKKSKYVNNIVNDYSRFEWGRSAEVVCVVKSSERIFSYRLQGVSDLDEDTVTLHWQSDKLVL